MGDSSVVCVRVVVIGAGIATLVPEITYAMQHAVTLDVALKVSVGAGKSWGDI